MRQHFLLTLICTLIIAGAARAQERALPVDTMVTTQHSVAINGVLVPYTAVTGTQPVWDEMGQPIASLHYTYYSRNNVKNRDERP